MTKTELTVTILKEKLALYRIRMQYSFSGLVLLGLFMWGPGSPITMLTGRNLLNPNLVFNEAMLTKDLKSIWPFIVYLSVFVFANAFIGLLFISSWKHSKTIKELSMLKPDSPNIIRRIGRR